MKFNRFKKVLTVLGAAAVLSSCSAKFLEVEPYGKSKAEEYYQTDEEVKLALVAAYDMLSTDQFQGWSSCYVIKNLPSDDVNCGGGNSSDQPQYQELDDFNWHPENLGIRSYYHINYFGVYRANLIISSAPEDASDLMKT